MDKKELTFDQQMQLRRFYELKQERRVKNLNKALNILKPKIKIFYTLLWVGFWLIMEMSLCAIIGMSLVKTIYYLNYPLGIGYATFASYVVAIGIFLLLPKLWSIKK